MRLAMFLSAMAPALVWLFYFRERDGFATEAENVWSAFGIGAAVAWPVVVIVHFMLAPSFAANGVYTQAFTDAFLCAAVPEETFKLIAVASLFYRHQDTAKPHDVVVLAVAVSVGFAAFENLFMVDQATRWPAVALARSVTAVPGHAFTGAVMGAFLAAATFGRRRWLLWPAAFVVPVLLHGLYDFFVFVHALISEAGRESEMPVAAAAYFAFVAVVIAEGLLAFLCSGWILRVERRHDLTGNVPSAGRLLQGWMRRPGLRAWVWGVPSVLLVCTGVILALAATGFPSAWHASGPSQYYVGAAFGFFAVFHGTAFLLHMRQTRGLSRGA